MAGCFRASSSVDTKIREIKYLSITWMDISFPICFQNWIKARVLRSLIALVFLRSPVEEFDCKKFFYYRRRGIFPGVKGGAATFCRLATEMFLVKRKKQRRETTASTTLLPTNVAFDLNRAPFRLPGVRSCAPTNHEDFRHEEYSAMGVRNTTAVRSIDFLYRNIRNIKIS